MGLEASSVVPEPSIFLPFPKTRWGRVTCALYLIVAPALAFWGIDALGPEWQSGDFSTYLALFLSPEASLVFLLLLAYSLLCYLSLLVSPARDAKLFFIRFGIYTGTWLALQYSILALTYFLDRDMYAVILVWIFPPLFLVAYGWAVGRWDARTINTILLVVLSGLLLVGIVFARNALILVVVILAVTAPFWSFLIALRATIWLFKYYETGFNLPRGLGLTAWLAAYVIALRFDILRMYELYAALPKEPPNCYIATAAAHGHPRFVQSWTVQRVDGKSMQVNRQLQRLKCAELALMAVHPRLHRLLRRIYDVIGKRLARRIQNPFLADAAYLLLKPWEWCAGLVLQTIAPEIDSISKKMYINC